MTESASQSWEANILRSDDLPDNYVGSGTNYPVLGSDYLREQISSVTVLDTLADMPADAWDVSEAGNGSVMAWVKPNGDLFDLYLAGEGGVSAGSSCECLFSGYQNATSITLGDHFDTSNVQNMNYMFCGCLSLKELNLGDHFDTSSVQNMGMMFYFCESLTELNLGDHFDTSNVQEISMMFAYCESLKELNLGDHFNTANVQHMNGMFSGCYSLRELNLGDHFDTANVQDMITMFADCHSLRELNLGDKFVTANADTTDMFSNCPAGEDYQHLLH